MSLKAKITEDMKAAMKGGEKDRLAVIRLVQAQGAGSIGSANVDELAWAERRQGSPPYCGANRHVVEAKVRGSLDSLDRLAHRKGGVCHAAGKGRRPN